MRDPGWYWIEVEWQTSMIPAYWYAGEWKYPGLGVRLKPVKIGPRIEEPSDE